jgi:hypothetical protein
MRSSLAVTHGTVGLEDPSMGWTMGVERPKMMMFVVSFRERCLVLLRVLLIFPLVAIARAGLEKRDENFPLPAYLQVFDDVLSIAPRMPRIVSGLILMFLCGLAATQSHRNWNVIHPFAKKALPVFQLFEIEYSVLPFVALVFPLLFPGMMTLEYVDVLWFTPFAFFAFAVFFGTLFVGWSPTPATVDAVAAARHKVLNDHPIAAPILTYLDARAQLMVDWAKTMTVKSTAILIVAAVPNGVAEMRTMWRYFEDIPSAESLKGFDFAPIYVSCFLGLLQGTLNMLFYYIWMVHGVSPWLAQNASYMISLGELINPEDGGNRAVAGFDVTNVDHMLAWVECRAYCLRAPMRVNYKRGGASIASSVVGGMGCMAGVIFNVVMGQAYTSGGQFSTVGPTMVCWSALGVWTLKKMAGIYDIQQRHVKFLRVHQRRARILAPAMMDGEAEGSKCTPKMLQEMVLEIDGEIEVPQVFGVAVTQRTFKLVLGYMSGGLVSLVGGQFTTLFDVASESSLSA